MAWHGMAEMKMRSKIRPCYLVRAGVKCVEADMSANNRPLRGQLVSDARTLPTDSVPTRNRIRFIGSVFIFCENNAMLSLLLATISGAAHNATH